METVNALGRRKEAVARVYVNEGAGKIVINGRDIETYFPSSILRYIVLQPLNKLGVAEKYDIKVTLDGGGFKGQAEALRLAIARALVKINPEDKVALKAEGFMTEIFGAGNEPPVVRTIVVPPPGMVMVEADFQQALEGPQSREGLCKRK